MVGLFVVLMMVGVCIVAFGWHSPVRKYWISAGALVSVGSIFALIGSTQSSDLPNGSPGATAFGVILILLSVPVIVLASRNGRVAQVSRQTAAKLMSFDEKGSTLTLLGRGPSLRSFISMGRHDVLSVSHKPEQLVFTGATVGSVTTGGFSKVGGYDYLSGIKKSDKYELKTGGYAIHTIKLSPELLEQAKQSPVKDFIRNGNQIIVVDPEKYDKNLYQTMDMLSLMRTNYSMFLTVSARVMEPGYPEYEKCRCIYDWICSE